MIYIENEQKKLVYLLNSINTHNDSDLVAQNEVQRLRKENMDLRQNLDYAISEMNDIKTTTNTNKHGGSDEYTKTLYMIKNKLSLNNNLPPHDVANYIINVLNRATYSTYIFKIKFTCCRIILTLYVGN